VKATRRVVLLGRPHREQERHPESPQPEELFARRHWRARDRSRERGHTTRRHSRKPAVASRRLAAGVELAPDACLRTCAMHTPRPEGSSNRGMSCACVCSAVPCDAAIRRTRQANRGNFGESQRVLHSVVQADGPAATRAIRVSPHSLSDQAKPFLLLVTRTASTKSRGRSGARISFVRMGSAARVRGAALFLCPATSTARGPAFPRPLSTSRKRQRPVLLHLTHRERSRALARAGEGKLSHRGTREHRARETKSRANEERSKRREEATKTRIRRTGRWRFRLVDEERGARALSRFRLIDEDNARSQTTPAGQLLDAGQLLGGAIKTRLAACR
jgi:hypothetical protein